MVRQALIAGVLLCAGGVATAQVQSGNAGFVEIPGSMEFSGRVIVKPLQADALKERGLDVQAAYRQAVANLAQYQEYHYEPLVDHYVLFVPAGSTENQFVAQLMATGLYEFAEPDWTLYPIVCPDDSFFNVQYHHNASHMESCAAWDIHTGGSAVTVGICDTGIETSHPDLQLHRLEGYNAVDRLWESQGGNISAVHWHGTAVTGCSAANGDNATGVAGVGWNLSHRMMRVSNSSGGSASLSTLTHAALTSVQSGDRVANVSYSGVNSSSVRSTATQIKSLGGLLTWSAGNDGGIRDWGDRDNDDVIVVGATAEGDGLASFSATGASVDLVAPGDSVATTYTGAGYAYVSGTSFSAPLTAGLIGLIWSYNPSLTPDQVEDILKASCDDLGASGEDNTYGHGRINALNALLLAGGDPGNTPPSVTISSPSNGSAFTEGDSVTFIGSASDNEDGDLTASITWTSNLDGVIGSGASFSTSTLSVGVHTVTAAVTDNDGAGGNDAVQFEIEQDLGSPPAAPTGLTAGDNGDGTAALAWGDNSDNEDVFEFQRENQHKNGRWRATTNFTVPADSTSHDDDCGSGTFRYRVRANNAAGSSAWTGWVIVDVTGGGGNGNGNGNGNNGNGGGRPGG